MRILDNKNNKDLKDVKLCVERFETMITNDISMNDIFEILDDIMYDYARYSINDNVESNIVLDNLFYLKRLRDLFVENSTNEK